MLPDDLNTSLADLSSAGIRLSAGEAVTIVRELALQVLGGALPGVPSAHVIRLTPSGQLHVEGPISADDEHAVSCAAALLDTLLPGFEAPADLRTPGALRLVAARALGTLDLPPYRTLQDFVDDLARFAAPDPSGVLADLMRRWARTIESREAPAAVEPEDEAHETAAIAPLRLEPLRSEAASTALTISDIRRARRATGLTLDDVAARSRIPAWMLRELEWGYLRNWPVGHYGRTQLVRYARASGLDEQLVVRTVWPMLDARPQIAQPIVPAEEPLPGAERVEYSPAALGAAVDYVDAEPIETFDVPLVPRSDAPPATRRRAALLAALAIPALIAIGVAPMLLQREAGPQPPLASTAPPAATQQASPPSADPAATSAAEATGARGADRREIAGSRAPVPSAARPVPAEAPLSKPRPAEGLDGDSAYSPAFASEGTAMFYHQRASGESALMRADTNSDGTVLRVTRIVDDNASNFHARPSPDGARVAFDSDREGERAVFVANADGTGVRRISGDGFAAIPSWSPDGQRLAYVRAEADRPRVWNVWITDLGSGATERVTSYPVGQPWGASWFPDGRRIAYSHETRLVIRDLTTGAERRFASPIKGRLVRTPAVSPDGRRIVFQVYRDGTWLLDTRDGAMRKVLSDPSAEEFSWSPDGRRLAYHSRQSGTWGVWMMAAR
jgi:hypothetical protein